MIESEHETFESSQKELYEAIANDKYIIFRIEKERIEETLSTIRVKGKAQVRHFLSAELSRANYPALLKHYELNAWDGRIFRDDHIPFFFQGMLAARNQVNNESVLSGTARMAFDAGFAEWDVYCSLDDAMHGVKIPNEPLAQKTGAFTQPEIALLYFHLKEKESHLLRPDATASNTSSYSIEEFTALSGYNERNSAKKQRIELNKLMKDEVERTGCSSNLRWANYKKAKYTKVIGLLTERNCLNSLTSIEKDFATFTSNYKRFHGELFHHNK